MSYFTDQINDQELGHLFWPAIRKVRRAEIEKSKKEFRWGDPEYKLYPSSIKSWSCCPKKVVQDHSKWNGISDLDGIYRTRRGKAMHWEFQQDFLRSDRRAPEPNKANMPDRIRKKLEDNPSEVPFQSLITGFSGSVDSVLQTRAGEIIPVEIKSTGKDSIDWEYDILKQFPRTMESWTIQLCIYIHHLNMLEYYPTRISRGILAVVNSREDSADKYAYLEYRINYSEFQHRTEELVKHLSWQRLAYIMQDDLKCPYPLCREHTK